MSNSSEPQRPERIDEERFRAHFSAAVGTFLERASIGIAMVALEDDYLSEKRMELSPEDQAIFMTSYASMVTWVLANEIRTVVAQPELTQIVDALQAYISTETWYRQDAFPKLWKEMQIFMPMAMNCDVGAPPPYPLADMLLAADAAGYPLSNKVRPSLKFGTYVLWRNTRLVDFARFAITEHLKSRQS